MTLKESILACLKNYAEFNGRAERSEFWWFTIFGLLVGAALALLDKNLSGLFLLLTFLPQLAVGTRRLHDIGRSGWWQLFALVPIGGLVLVALLWALPGRAVAALAPGAS